MSAILLRFRNFRLQVLSDDLRFKESISPWRLFQDEQVLEYWFGQGVLPLLRLLAVQSSTRLILRDVDVDGTIADNSEIKPTDFELGAVDSMQNRFWPYQLRSLDLLRRFDRFTVATWEGQDPLGLVKLFLSHFAGRILLIAAGKVLNEHFHQVPLNVVTSTATAVKAHDDFPYDLVLSYGHLPFTQEAREGLFAIRSRRAISILDPTGLSGFGNSRNLSDRNIRDRWCHLNYFGPVMRIDDNNVPESEMTLGSGPSFDVLQHSSIFSV